MLPFLATTARDQLQVCLVGGHVHAGQPVRRCPFGCRGPAKGSPPGTLTPVLSAGNLRHARSHRTLHTRVLADFDSTQRTRALLAGKVAGQKRRRWRSRRRVRRGRLWLKLLLTLQLGLPSWHVRFEGADLQATHSLHCQGKRHVQRGGVACRCRCGRGSSTRTRRSHRVPSCR